MGTGMHAGLAAHFKGTPEPATALTEALAREWPDDAPQEYSRDGHEAQALKVLDRLLKWVGKEMLGVDVLMVEHSLGLDGHTTPDLVTRENGVLTVTDWKYSHYVPADRIHYRLEGIERTHQFLHYAWAVGEYMGEPVRQFRKVVIVGGPVIKVVGATFDPQPYLANWLAQSQVKWAEMRDMERMPELVYRREQGCMMFGDKWPCQMFEACWTCHGDKEMMKNFYTREEK